MSYKVLRLLRFYHCDYLYQIVIMMSILIRIMPLHSFVHLTTVTYDIKVYEKFILKSLKTVGITRVYWLVGIADNILIN